MAESSPQVDSKHMKSGDAFAGGGLYFAALEYDKGVRASVLKIQCSKGLMSLMCSIVDPEARRGFRSAGIVHTF